MIYEFIGRVKKLSIIVKEGKKKSYNCEFESNYKGEKEANLAKEKCDGKNNYIVIKELNTDDMLFDFLLHCRDERLNIEFDNNNEITKVELVYE